MMSTSQVSAVDRENSAAHLGTHEKNLGSQRRWGELQTRNTPIPKQFESNSTNLQKSFRSFGEISNTLDRGSDSSRNEVHKKMTSKQVLSSASEDPEFVHLIPRKKDYSDIFPPSLSMSNDQLADFTRFWKGCQKPDLQTLQISTSPPRDLTLLPIMQENKIVLEPVPEDLFNLPPPWE